MFHLLPATNLSHSHHPLSLSLCCPHLPLPLSYCHILLDHLTFISLTTTSSLINSVPFLPLIYSVPFLPPIYSVPFLPPIYSVPFLPPIFYLPVICLTTLLSYPLSHSRLQQLLRVLCAWHCDEFNSPLDRGVVSRILQVLPLFIQSSFSPFLPLHSCLKRPFPLPLLSPLLSLLTFLLISFLPIHLPFLSLLSSLFPSSFLLNRLPFLSPLFLSSPSPLFPFRLFPFCQISSSKGDGVLAGIAIKVKMKIRTALYCGVLYCAVLYNTLPSFLSTPLPPVCTLSAVTYLNLLCTLLLSCPILSQLLIKYGYPVQRSDYLCCAHACLGETCCRQFCRILN
jgi:hypothetical protein